MPPNDPTLSFFQAQLEKIKSDLSTKPSHSSGPKKPSLSQQESKAKK